VEGADHLRLPPDAGVGSTYSLAPFRRHRWVRRAAWAVGAIAIAYAAALLLARPVPPHTYFTAERPGVQVIAHRGGAGLRPEETLAAFEHAASLGADILERDVRETADGAIVVLHDATVERTTDGSGPVAELRLEALRGLDAGYRWTDDGGRSYPYRGAGIRVPTLAEVYQRHARMRMVVEMKVRTPEFAQALCRLTREAGMTERVLVASFDHATLVAFRQACPEVATSMSAREVQVFIAMTRLGLSSLASPDAVALQAPDRIGDFEVLAPSLVAAARRRNLRVHVWTVNEEPEMRRLIALGVDGIMTDRPDRLLALRGGADPSR
jgi:glycerophosphoryl diester phosphodiesterase